MVEVRYAGIPGAQLKSPGHPASVPLRIRVDPNRTTPVRIFVTVPAGAVGAGSRAAAFEVRTARETRTMPTAFEFGNTEP
jgi:hypothetical protein